MTQQTQALTVHQQVSQQLTSPQFMASLKANLPDHITPERFARVAVMALQKNPKLLDSDRQSLYQAIQACAQDGLIPDGREAALVPYGDKVQYLPMIGGILKKIRNSGELLTIMAQTVRKNDVFKYYVDENGEHLEHRPDMLADRGEFVGVYALAQTKDGGKYMEVMTKAEVEKVRNVSRAKNAGPWVDWYEEQAEKTVLKRMSKRMPMSTDKIAELLERDNEEYAEVVEAPPAAPAEVPKPSTGAGARARAATVDAAPPATPAPTPTQTAMAAEGAPKPLGTNDTLI